jgi:hypothetical protein
MPFAIWSRERRSEPSGYFSHSSNWRDTEVSATMDQSWGGRLRIRIEDPHYAVAIDGKSAMHLLEELIGLFSLQRPPPDRLQCSFCHKGNYQVKKLIQSEPPHVYICNECVEACVERLSELERT